MNQAQFIKILLFQTKKIEFFSKVNVYHFKGSKNSKD